MHRYKEINTSNDKMNNLQANGKRATDDNEGYDDEKMSIHKRQSAYPIDFGMSKSKDLDGLLHLHYPINDRNK